MTVFSPLERVIRGSVAGKWLLEIFSAENMSQGVIQIIIVSQAQPCKKLFRNLFHLLLSSCFPKSIPTNPIATAPLPEKSKTRGRLAIKNMSPAGISIHRPTVIGKPREKPSQILARKVVMTRKPSIIRIKLEFFYCSIWLKKYTHLRKNLIVQSPIACFKCELEKRFRIWFSHTKPPFRRFYPNPVNCNLF